MSSALRVQERLLKFLRKFSNVQIVQLPATRQSLDEMGINLMESSDDPLAAPYCNLPTAKRYLENCEDGRCELWAAKVGDSFQGFMMIRRGLQPDLRWRPQDPAAAFRGFHVRSPHFDPDRVLDILVLCANGGLRGVGQLLVLTALTMSTHGVFLEFTMTLEIGQPPPPSDVKNEWMPWVQPNFEGGLHYNHGYYTRAQEMYIKLDFQQVEVLDDESKPWQGLYMYRDKVMTLHELSARLKYLTRHGTVTNVPELSQADQDAVPVDAQAFEAWLNRRGSDVDATAASAIRAGSAVPVFGVPGETDTDTAPFPGAGPSSVSGVPIPSDEDMAFVLFPPVPVNQAQNNDAHHPNHNGGVIDLAGWNALVSNAANRGGGGAEDDIDLAGLNEAIHAADQFRDDGHRVGQGKGKGKGKGHGKGKGKGHGKSHGQPMALGQGLVDEEDELTHPPPGLIYPCPKCNQVFDTAELRDVHKKTHYHGRAGYVRSPRGNERDMYPGRHECERCGRVFNRKDNLQRHLHEAHEPAQQAWRDKLRSDRKEAECAPGEGCFYKCRQCRITFRGPNCPDCTSRFRGKSSAYSNWIRHERTVHQRVRGPAGKLAFTRQHRPLGGPLVLPPQQ